MNKTKAKRRSVIDPVARFAGWHFAVDCCHYSIFQIKHRFNKNNNCHEYLEPPNAALCFQVGDLFINAGSMKFLQVVALLDAGNIEVHSGVVGSQSMRSGYVLQCEHMPGWLKSGEPPKEARQIAGWQSRSVALALMIQSEL